MTIKELLNNAIIKFKNIDFTNPHLEAEILLSKILKKPRAWILSHPESKPTKLQITKYKLQISQRCQGVPLAYLTGEKEFYGLNFKVNKHVLIPRPETEMMVDLIVDRKSWNVDRKTIIIDVGTGSGCIIISIAKALTSAQFPISPPGEDPPRADNFQFLATDISKPALTVARKNANLHGVKDIIKFKTGNLLEPLYPDLRSAIRDTRITICANLPYLTPKDFRESPTIKKEPKTALIGGSDGLKYYRELFKQVRSVIRHPSSVIIMCEIDPSQVKKIRQMAKSLLPEFEVSIEKDLAGKARICMLSSGKNPSERQYGL